MCSACSGTGAIFDYGRGDLYDPLYGEVLTAIFT